MINTKTTSFGISRTGIANRLDLMGLVREKSEGVSV